MTTFEPVSVRGESSNILALTNGLTLSQDKVRSSSLCSHCLQPFTRSRRDQKFCGRECQRASSRNAARNTKRANVKFIGVDGEGITHDDGTHDYIMLSVGPETLYDAAGLDHHKVFPFLYDQFRQHPDHVFVGFYLTYDFTQWLKSLDEITARLLIKGSSKRKIRAHKRTLTLPVYVDGWDIDILGMKRFQLRPHRHKPIARYDDHAHTKYLQCYCGLFNPPEQPSEPWLFVCDAGPYWQCAFLSAIDPRRWPVPVLTDEEYNTIVEGKSRRQDSEHDIAAMRRYNILENDVLARIMRPLADGYMATGVRMRRDLWYGPGSAAEIWLGNYADRISRELVPEFALLAGRSSYFGGRFELTMHGHIPGKVYEYDVQSAYPDAIRNLPCLCGHWAQSDGTATNPFLVYGEFRGSNPWIGGLPHRTDKGSVVFPHITRGWVLWAEVEAAINAGLVDSVEIEKTISYTPCGHPPPLAEIAPLFDLRLRVGKNSAQGKALKLLLNSCYGKLAQSIGSAKYGHSIYASMITSACRTKMLEAIGSHPNGAREVVMIATDGIIFRTRHPYLDCTPDTLGRWEEAEKDGLTVMKPGVYWDDKTRASIAADKLVGIKSRGVAGAVLAKSVAVIDDQFQTMTCEDDMPSVISIVPFSVQSPAMALAGHWDTVGQVRQNIPHRDTCRLAPKRAGLYHDEDVWRSSPAIPAARESVGYKRMFGLDLDGLGE